MYYHIEAIDCNNKTIVINNVKLIMLPYELKWLSNTKKINKFYITTSEKEKL